MSYVFDAAASVLMAMVFAAYLLHPATCPPFIGDREARRRFAELALWVAMAMAVLLAGLVLAELPW